MSIATKNTMKTLLIILTSLFSAFSKPAMLENHIHGFETTLNLPDFTSVKNVPKLKTHEFRKVNDNGADEIIHANNELIISPMEGNNRHGSKAVTEIENKMGLRVYRDSDDGETLNDSQRKCKKQVQLKFCEDESEIISQMRHDSTIIKARLMTKQEIEERIKMAKEALEHLKKYLKVESNSKPKEDSQNDLSQKDEYEIFHSLVNNMGNVQLTNLNSVSRIDKKNNETIPEQNRLTNGDTRAKQLNFDIEVISGVLDDYITQMQDTLTTELNGEQTNTTKLVESRMDQWKDNIDKIQNDVDVGINIEDRFKNENGNDDFMQSFQTSISGKEDTTLALKPGLSAEDNLDRKFNYDNKVQNGEKMLKNNERDAELIMTQDIKSSSNLYSDSLRLESGNTLMSESPELTTTSDLTSNKQNDLSKYLESEHFEDKNNGRQEHVEKTVFRIDGSDETKAKKLQEQEETSVIKHVENILENVKSMTDLTDKSLIPNNKNLNKNMNTEMRNSDATIPHLITENDDINKVNTNEHENIESLQSLQERDEINQKSNEKVFDHEQMPSFAKDSLNTMKSLSTTFDTNPPISTPLREAMITLEETSNLPFQPKRKEDTNIARERDEISKTPKWSNHADNVQHMKTVKDNNEIIQALYNPQTENLTARKTNDLGKINDPLLRKFNGHVNTQWPQIRNTDMAIPHTLTNVNIKEGVKPNMHSDDSGILSFDRTHERNNVNGKENTRWIPESSAHENSGVKPFEDPFLHMPAFRTTHPDLNFKNSEMDFLKTFDSRMINERFPNDFTNLRDNSFSSGMIPVQHAREENRDNMVQASEHMDRRQMMQKSTTDYAQSWYNRGGMARGSSYNQEQVNVPSSTGSGTVGLFPNANRGCAIPLLVSCSPSVVSGSLAKGQPSYSTHSYGSTDNYKFHKKRETTKINDVDVNKTNHIKS